MKLDNIINNQTSVKVNETFKAKINHHGGDATVVGTTIQRYCNDRVDYTGFDCASPGRLATAIRCQRAIT